MVLRAPACTQQLRGTARAPTSRAVTGAAEHCVRRRRGGWSSMARPCGVVRRDPGGGLEVSASALRHAPQAQFVFGLRLPPWRSGLDRRSRRMMNACTPPAMWRLRLAPDVAFASGTSDPRGRRERMRRPIKGAIPASSGCFTTRCGVPDFDRVGARTGGCRNAPHRRQEIAIPFDSRQMRVMFADAAAPQFRTA